MKSLTFDYATFLGLFGGVGFIFSAIYLGGELNAFVNTPSIMIVCGGTMMLTLVSFQINDILLSGSVFFKTLVYRHRSPHDVALELMYIAEFIKKRGGILALQDIHRIFRYDSFLYKCLQNVIDGMPYEEQNALMHNEIKSMRLRHKKGVMILRRAAEIAPSMGLIGTLIGLVQMLSTLDDPSKIGPSMAVALLTTFYGAILSSVILSPLASKLERNSEQEFLVKELQHMAVLSLIKVENPRRIEAKLNSLLPPNLQIIFTQLSATKRLSLFQEFEREHHIRGKV